MLAVAHSLHFARAAGTRYFAARADQAGAETEQLLGTRLFQRSKRAVSLTAAGELFVLEASRALGQLAQAQEVARRAGRGELGRLEIGYVASAAYSGVLQDQFARFRASHPGIHIGAREYAMDTLPGLLDQGRVDLAFVRPPLHLPDGLDSVVLLRDRFVLAVQADSPWRCLTWRRRPRWHSRRLSCRNRNGNVGSERRGGFAAQVVSRPGSLVAVLTEVSLGVGCAIVPHS